jgi:hypothetical protein
LILKNFELKYKIMSNLNLYEIAFWTKSEDLNFVNEIKNFLYQKEDEKILKEHPKFGKLYWILGYIQKTELPKLEKFLRSSKNINQFIIIKVKKKKVEKETKENNLEKDLDKKLEEILNYEHQ